MHARNAGDRGRSRESVGERGRLRENARRTCARARRSAPCEGSWAWGAAWGRWHVGAWGRACGGRLVGRARTSPGERRMAAIDPSIEHARREYPSGVHATSSMSCSKTPRTTTSAFGEAVTQIERIASWPPRAQHVYAVPPAPWLPPLLASPPAAAAVVAWRKILGLKAAHATGSVWPTKSHSSENSSVAIACGQVVAVTCQGVQPAYIRCWAREGAQAEGAQASPPDGGAPRQCAPAA